jgi:hypothetical protein
MTAPWLLRFVRILLAMAMLIVSGAALADPAPQTLVRAHLEPSGPVVAGSQVELVVELLTTSFFTHAPDWPLFNVPDALVTLPDEQAVNLSETMDGTRWFGVSRAYRITPQAARTYEIPAFAITVYPGGASGPVRVTTPALKLETSMPPGAQGMRVFFPTQKLVASQKIEPAQGRIRVGDTVTRTITQTATSTESMLIPPVVFGDIEGLRRYARPSATRNLMQDRAGLVAGERTDSTSYMADRSGRFSLPPVSIEWWNTKTQNREVIDLPAVTFSAVAAHEKPVFDIPVDSLKGMAPHKVIVVDRSDVFAGCVILILALAAVWLYPQLTGFYQRIRRTLTDARKRYREGDIPAWRALRSAAREGSLQHVVPTLYDWMDRSPDFEHPARLDRLAPSSSPEVRALIDAVTGHYAVTSDHAVTSNPVETLDRAVTSERAADSKPAERSETTPHWQRAIATLRTTTRRARKQRMTAPALPPLNLD